MTTTDDKVSPEIGSVVIGYELNEDPVANAGGPYVVAENVSLMLNGSASSDPNSDAITYEWDFDYDGSFDVDSTAISPSITYPDGLVTMTVALRVTDESDATHVNTTTVTVNNIAPTSVAGSDQIVNEGDTVNFSGSGTDVPSDTLSYDWDFDYDNITFNIDDSGTNVSTSYADGPATYTVALRVSDDDGGATVDTLTVTVNNVNPEVYVGLDLMGDEGSLIAFSAVITDVGSADTHTYEWDFGDGVTSTLATPSHSYADNGVYLVMLTVLDDDNGVGVDTLNVTVSNVDPVVEVGPNLSGDEGSVIAFSAVITDSGSADTHTYDWDFGDGNSSTQAAPSHTYADNGVYNVTLMVLDDDGGGPAVDSLTVTVDNVAPTVEIGSDKNVGEGTIVPFSAIVTDPGSGDTHIYDWSFGDGNSSTQAAPSHTFADNGVYTVTLTLSDDDGGGPAVDQLVVTVTNVDPVIDAGSYTAAGGDMVIFSVAIIDAAGDTHTIEWDLDFNGSYETVSASPSRSYILAGIYQVGVRVTDDDGAIVTDTAQVTITSNSPTAFSIYIPFTARSYDSAGSSVARPTGNQSSFNIVIWWATLIQQMMSR